MKLSWLTQGVVDPLLPEVCVDTPLLSTARKKKITTKFQSKTFENLRFVS